MNHKAKVKLSGQFTFELYDKNGKFKKKWKASNAVVNQGLDYILDVFFFTVAKPTWYVGLIRDDNYSALAAGDTMASHGGWEEADEYDEATRQEITFVAASSQSTANATRVHFSINASETMKGAFLTNDSTKSGSAGKLYCTALNDGGDEAVVDGDVIKVTYTVGSAAA